MSAAAIVKIAGAPTGSARHWLKTATEWRVLSLFFQFPTRSSRRELRSLLPKISKPLAAVAKNCLTITLRDAEAEYHRVLGAGGIPAVESSYDPNALAGRGPLLADVRGFYEAFAYRPEKPPAELPDHIAVQFDFLSYLAFKTAFAVHERSTEQLAISSEAHQRFVAEHLQTWLTAFTERLEQAASPIYSPAVLALNLYVRTRCRADNGQEQLERTSPRYN